MGYLVISGHLVQSILERKNVDFLDIIDIHVRLYLGKDFRSVIEFLLIIVFDLDFGNLLIKEFQSVLIEFLVFRCLFVTVSVIEPQTLHFIVIESLVSAFRTSDYGVRNKF